MDVQEVRWGGLDSIKLAKDRDSWRTLVNGVMNLTLASPCIIIQFRLLMQM